MSVQKETKVRNLIQQRGLLHVNSGKTGDIGLVGEYTDETTKFGGFFRDATDGSWNLFDSLSTAPDWATDSINKGATGFSLANLNLGQLNVDNLRMDGNTLSSTDTNGDLTIAPNGTGKIVLNNATVDAAPTADLGVATKLYVDGQVQSAVQGWVAKSSVVVRTSAALTVNAAGSALGKTLTSTANGPITDVASSFDNVFLEVGDRVLVVSQPTLADNGIYVVSSAGSAGTPWVLTRATDADETPGGELSRGAHVFVDDGDLYQSTGWVLQGPFDNFIIDSSAFVTGESGPRKGDQIWVKFSKDTAVSYTASNTGSGIGVYAGMNGTEFQFNSLRAAQVGGTAGMLTVDNTTNPDGALTYVFDQSKITGTGTLASGSINWTGAIATTSTVSADSGMSIATGGLTFTNPTTDLNKIVAKQNLDAGLKIVDDGGADYITFDTLASGDGRNVIVNQKLHATAAATFDSTISVTGAATLSGGATVDQGITLNTGDFTFANPSTGLNKIVAKSGLDAGLKISDDATNDYITFDTLASGDGRNVIVNQNLRAASTFNAVGAATFDSTIYVAGATTLSGGASVDQGIAINTGELTFANSSAGMNKIVAKSGLDAGLKISDDATNDYITFDTLNDGDGRNVIINQKLHATAAATFDSTIYVAGAATLSGGASVDQGIAINTGELTFANSSAGMNKIVAKSGLDAGLKISDDATNDYITFDTLTTGDGRNVIVNQNLRAASTFNAVGAATFDSTIYVAGAATLSGGATVDQGIAINTGELTFANSSTGLNKIVAKSGLDAGLKISDDAANDYITFDTLASGDGRNVIVNQNLRAASTLDVTGAATFGSTLSVTSDATVGAIGTSGNSVITRDYLDLKGARQTVRARTTANFEGTATGSAGARSFADAYDINTSAAFDGVTLAAGDRVLLANQTSTQDNGIYLLVSNSAGGYVLNRADDSNTAAKNVTGVYTLVLEGATYARTFWTISAAGTFGTDPIVWSQAGGSSTFTSLTTEEIAFTGATGDNKIVLPDNEADALSFADSTQTYLRFQTTTGDGRVTAMMPLYTDYGVTAAGLITANSGITSAGNLTFTNPASVLVPSDAAGAWVLADANSTEYLSVDSTLLGPKLQITAPTVEVTGAFNFPSTGNIGVDTSLSFNPLGQEENSFFTMSGASLTTTFTQKVEIDDAVSQAADRSVITRQTLRTQSTKDAVVARSTGDLTTAATWSAGVWTGTTAGRLLSEDAALFDSAPAPRFAVGARLLVVGQTAPEQNGIYEVTNAGVLDPAAAWVLTRATDADSVAKLWLGSSVVVALGTLWGKTLWAVTTPPTTINTTAMVFEQVDSDDVTTMTFTGATGANAITVPDNLADALNFKSTDSKSYIRLNTTDGSEAVEFDQYATFGSDAEVGGALKLTGTGIEFNNTNTGVNAIKLQGNLADAMHVVEGGNTYISFDTSVFNEKVVVHRHLTATSINASGNASLMGVQLGVTEISSSTTLNAAHNILNVTTGSSTIILTLPSAANAAHLGRTYKLLKVDSGVGTVSITPDSTDLIDGENTPFLLEAQNDYTQITCHGSAGWFLH